MLNHIFILGGKLSDPNGLGLGLGLKLELGLTDEIAFQEPKYGFERFTQKNLRQTLSEELKKRKLKNSNYSLRALARDLDMSHTSLSEFIHGRRRFSFQMCEKILNNLKLNRLESENIKENILINSQMYSNLSPEQLEHFRKWHLFAIAELPKLKKFKPDPLWIAKVLNLPPQEVEESVQSLQMMGWLKITEDGKWHIIEENTTTFGSMSSIENLTKVSLQFTELQKKFIEMKKPELGSNLGLTLAINTQDLPKARELTYQYLNNMSQLLEDKKSNKQEVYHLKVSLFPISNAEGEM